MLGLCLARRQLIFSPIYDLITFSHANRHLKIKKQVVLLCTEVLNEGGRLWFLNCFWHTPHRCVTDQQHREWTEDPPVELATLLCSCKNAYMYGSSVPDSPFIHSWDGARQFHSNSAAPRAIQRRPDSFPLSVRQMRIELPRVDYREGRVVIWAEASVNFNSLPRAPLLLALFCCGRSVSGQCKKENIMKYMCRARK